MYSISGYGAMMADELRVGAYALALRQSIRSDSVVLDLGCGAGIMSVLACHSGARRVYAIEPTNVIEVAREIARANGCEERIVFIQDFSTRVKLPEPVDVVFSDLRGVLPFFQHHIPSIIDARRRFLAAGGVLVPKQDTLWAVLVEAPEIFQSMREGWEGDKYGVDLKAGLRYSTNTWRKGRVLREQFLAKPQCWTTVDYAAIEDSNVKGDITWKVDRACTGHGFQVWFDTALSGSEGFSNAPWERELVYGNAFFPFHEEVDLVMGDRVTVHLAADLVGDDYVWRWNTRVTDATNPEKNKISFQQSTFLGVPLSPAQLRRQASDHIPTVSRDGEIDQRAIGMMDGKSSLEAISRKLAQEFPDRFAAWQQALTRVGELSQKYGR